MAKPTVACLWARTVRCKGCRATVPLLKTRWLCKKDNKRVLLVMEPAVDGTGVVFGVETGVPQARGNAAQRREHDKRLGAGTMSRSGARCPCCSRIMSMEDIRLEGRAGRLGAAMTAVVVDGPRGKEYRLPQEEELRAAEVSPDELDALYADIPFGLPVEPICAERPSPNSRGASGLPRYGFDRWRDVFTGRQLLALGAFSREIRSISEGTNDYPEEWREAIAACLAPSLGRLADRGSALATWTNDPEKIRSTFAPLRFAHGVGFRRVLPADRHHRRIHPGRRVDCPCRRAPARSGDGCTRRNGAAAVRHGPRAGRFRRDSAPTRPITTPSPIRT